MADTNLLIEWFRLLTVGFHEMSHAFAGVLTCAKIHSIELDRESVVVWVDGSSHVLGVCSGRGRCHADERWYFDDHAAGWVPGLLLYRGLLDCVWVRYQRIQDCLYCFVSRRSGEWAV